MKRGRGSRLKPEPVAAPAAAENPLDESEGEEDEVAGAGLGELPVALSAHASPETKQAEAFAAAMFKLMEGYHKNSGKAGSSLEKALESLEGAGSGSADSSALPSSRRNSAARKALRDGLVSSPDELSAVIENLMAEDLASSAPGVAVPGQVSARAWVEFRSKIGAYPSAMWATWIMSGALDCLRTNRPAQARARLNLGLLIFDQMSVNKGSFVLAGELALENPPPAHSYRQHEHHSTGLVYSRLLDPRWSEDHLKDQAEFLTKRTQLGRAQAATTPADPPEDETATPAPRRRRQTGKDA